MKKDVVTETKGVHLSSHGVEKREIHPHLKKIAWNQSTMQHVIL